MMFLSLIVAVALAVKVTSADLVHGKNPLYTCIAILYDPQTLNRLYYD